MVTPSPQDREQKDHSVHCSFTKLSETINKNERDTFFSTLLSYIGVMKIDLMDLKNKPYEYAAKF